jgi:hypothetical protein
MGELISRVDAGLFWGLIIGFGLGMWSTWRFARLFERVRDAVKHAKHHYSRAVEFALWAKSNVVAMVFSGVAFITVMGAVGFLVYLRVTG